MDCILILKKKENPDERQIALLKYQRLKPLAMVFDRFHSPTLPTPERFRDQPWND